MANLSFKRSLVTITWLICLVHCPATGQNLVPKTDPDSVMITNINPPLFGFYAKYLDCGGIAIRSSAVVSDKALVVAAQKINLMLANIPTARHNLAQWGAEIHIIGQHQQTSDLPEFRDMKGLSYVDNQGVTTNIDDRTRGLGGIYTSCGEENLLHLPGDRYAGGSDICTHEFAHNIMNYGLDDNLQKRITDQYHNAINKGLWKAAYAAVDPGEYWAELSMWYFGAHGEFLKGTQLPALGPAGLKAYDPEGYALLASIYSGKFHTTTTDVLPAKTVSLAAKPVSVDTKAWLMFTNNTSQKLKLFLIDPLGKARPYGAVSPFSKAIQKTFVGNIWRVDNEKGKAIGFYAAASAYAMVRLQ